MRTIEESLDFILEELMKNWDVSRPQDRQPLMCEPTMVTLGFADRFRKHEFFIRLIDRLIKDGYADHIDPHERTDLIKNPSLINFYEKNTIITVEGYYFITNEEGGYAKELARNIQKETTRLQFDSRMETATSDLAKWTQCLFWGTIFVGLATLALVITEILKAH